VNWHVTYYGFYFPSSLFNLVTQIRLAQDDDWTSTTLPGDDQVTFDTSWVEVLIERCDEKNSIDVRSDDLFFSAKACHLARELALPRQDSMDRYFVAFRRPPNYDPVSNYG
jgi:hypothetical protein